MIYLQLTQAGLVEGLLFVHPFVHTDKPVVDEEFQCRPLPSTSPRPPVMDIGEDVTEGHVATDAFVFVNSLPDPTFLDDGTGVD